MISFGNNHLAFIFLLQTSLYTIVRSLNYSKNISFLFLLFTEYSHWSQAHIGTNNDYRGIWLCDRKDMVCLSAWFSKKFKYLSSFRKAHFQINENSHISEKNRFLIVSHGDLEENWVSKGNEMNSYVFIPSNDNSRFSFWKILQSMKKCMKFLVFSHRGKNFER